jgi:hypothetical protein
MRGKEGAVDKVEALVWSLYTSGIRAFKRGDEDCTVTWFQKSDGSRWPHEGSFIWDRLRAYQDEQRKKGEPITLFIGEWHNRDYVQKEGQEVIFALNHLDRPEIRTFSRATEGVAKFTNFRWRPGHGQKEKAKVRIGPDYLSVVYPPFEIPKGGSNG